MDVGWEWGGDQYENKHEWEMEMGAALVWAWRDDGNGSWQENEMEMVIEEMDIGSRWMLK